MDSNPRRLHRHDEGTNKSEQAVLEFIPDSHHGHRGYGEDGGSQLHLHADAFDGQLSSVSESMNPYSGARAISAFYQPLTFFAFSA